MQFWPFTKQYKTDIETIPSVPPGGTNGKEVSSAASPYYDKWWYQPYNPADLYNQTGDYSLYDDMREDDQISSVLALKKVITLNSAWDIDSDDKDVKEFITWCLNDCLDDIFIKKLYQILSAMDYGFSVTEKIVSMRDYDGVQRIVFSALKTRAPHSWEFKLDDFGNMQEFKQNTNHGQVIFDRQKFIHYIYNPEFDNPYGNSELNKGVYRAWWSKNAIIKFWNIYLERFGMPTHVGKMPRSAGEADKSRFKNIIKNIQSKTGITLPEDFTLELLQVSKGAGEYETAIDKYNQMIARKMLIPDLMGFSGGKTSGGSYALGKEQFDIFYTLISYIRQDLERLVNREIVNPLVFWNFGDKYSASFKFCPIDEQQKSENMKLWLEAVKTGKVPVNDASINWYLKGVGAPEITEEELEEMQEAKDEMAAAIRGGGDDKNEDAPTDKPVDEVEDSDDVVQSDKSGEPANGEGVGPDDKAPRENTREYISESGTKFTRPLTKYENLANLNKIDKAMTGLTDEYKGKLAEQYDLMISALINDIKTKMIVEKRKIEQVNKLDLKYKGKAERLIYEMYKAGFDSGLQSVDTDVKKYGEDIANLTDEETQQWLAENSVYISTVENEEILQIVKPILLEGIRNGSGIKQIIVELRSALSGYNAEFDAVRLERMVRTGLSKAFNQARLQAWQGMAEFIAAFQYSAIMDSRTSDLCERLDEKVFTPEEAQYYSPPNHFSCRSVLIPIYKGQEYELSKMPGTEQTEGDFLKLVKEPKA